MFVLSKVFWIVATPGNLFLVLVLVGTAMLWFRRGSRWGRRVVTAAALSGLVVAVLPLGGWVLAPLEYRFPKVQIPPAKVDGVILLGGFASPHLSAVHGQPALNESAERLTTFVELASANPGARLIFSGGSASIFDTPHREATAVEAVLRQIGFDTGRVIFENEARNTYENAIRSLPLADIRADAQWVLITSAFHMPRAVGVFRKAGWSVLPYPVDFRTDGRGGFGLAFDFSGGLRGLGFGLKEWIGLVAYRALGRTSALFPAPDPD